MMLGPTVHTARQGSNTINHVAAFSTRTSSVYPNQKILVHLPIFVVGQSVRFTMLLTSSSYMQTFSFAPALTDSHHICDVDRRLTPFMLHETVA